MLSETFSHLYVDSFVFVFVLDLVGLKPNLLLQCFDSCFSLLACKTHLDITYSLFGGRIKFTQKSHLWNML